MTAALLYVLMALPAAPSWQGSVEVHTTTDQARCERMRDQLNQLQPGKYRCETLVSNVRGKA